MELKNKVFGFVAAAALTLSMFGSAAADDSAHGTVVLAPGTCSVSIAEATANFGTWTYNGATNQYVSSGNTTSNFSLTVVEHKPGGTCPVSLEFSGLASGSQNIEPSRFQGSVAGVGGGTLPGGSYGPVQLAGNTYPASLTLMSVPDDYQPGTYEGDIIVRVGSGA